MGEREGDEYRESHELGRKEKRLRRERGGSKFGEEDRDRGRKEKFREKVKNEKKNGRNVKEKRREMSVFIFYGIFCLLPTIG